jgi:nucleotide-binding universal stress UspA family protein
MRKILVAVDASDPAGMSAAVAEAVRIYAQGPVEVHLLNVQPAVNGHVAMFFGDRELHELQQAAGAEDLAPAEALLRTSNVPCTSSVRIGRRAETIARTARELGCDRVVLGREGGAASFASKVFGSLAQQVRQLLAGGGNCQVIGA